MCEYPQKKITPEDQRKFRRKAITMHTPLPKKLTDLRDVYVNGELIYCGIEKSLVYALIERGGANITILMHGEKYNKTK